jgi:hypothetical protein
LSANVARLNAQAKQPSGTRRVYLRSALTFTTLLASVRREVFPKNPIPEIVPLAPASVIKGQSYREIAEELGRSTIDVHRVAMTLGCAAVEQ